jgi:hypothetical protein
VSDLAVRAAEGIYRGGDRVLQAVGRAVTPVALAATEGIYRGAWWLMSVPSLLVRRLLGIRSPSRELADWSVTSMTITVDRPDVDDLRSVLGAMHHQALLDAEYDRGIGPRYGPPAG